MSNLHDWSVIKLGGTLCRNCHKVRMPHNFDGVCDMRQLKEVLDPTELLFCSVCGVDYEADPHEMATYFCPICQRKNKNIDAALKKLVEKDSDEAKNKVRDQDPE